jgi:branched-chain amino acid aminotransferase
MLDPLAQGITTLPPLAQLGFGRHLGAQVVTCEHDAAHGWSEPRVVPLAASALPLASAGVQYALSVFEGVKAYRAPSGTVHLFRVEAHAERLRRSARRLCLPDVDAALFVAMCTQATALHEALVPPHGAGALYLRPTLAATESFLGLRAAHSHVLAVAVSPCARPADAPVRLWLERTQVRAAPGGLGAVKTGANYAAGLAALERARSQGFDQALFVDAVEHERLAETGGSNVFVVLDDRVVTPALDDTILGGITRDSVLAILGELGHRVEERPPTLAELEAWARTGRLRELFVTGTAASAAPVSLLAGAGLRIEPPGGPLVAAVRRRLEEAQTGSGPCPDGWRRPVPSAGAAASVVAGAPSTRAAARAFAEAWAAAWNRRDVEAVLAWFADDVRFVSPRAYTVTGASEVRGKTALRAYWNAALERLDSIAFTVEDVSFDGEARRVVIAYRAALGGATLHASEQLTFAASGQIVDGAAYHGAPITG